MDDFDSPEMLFQVCRAMLESKFNHPTQSTHEVDANPWAASLPIVLKDLEQRVVDICADDIARMQTLKTMYTSYRNFILIHGGNDRDTPTRANTEEVSLRPPRRGG